MRKIVLFFFAANFLFAQGKSPQEIEIELEAAEAQFETALLMFNPYYQGPLITPSASMTPPGVGNLQPYLFAKESYATYDKQRHSVSMPHNVTNVNPQVILQTGITDTLDIAVTVQGDGNWQAGHSGGGFGDVSAVIGFPITRQSRYVPAIKFSIGESFPAGKYEHLSSNGLGLSATGSGSYQTIFGLCASKLLFWTTQHPLNIRAYCGYVVPSKVKVEGFNAYGGGFGTKGTVRPGNTLNADLGIELSITQKWVLATDIVYTSTSLTKFYGYPGVGADGKPASVGTGYSDNLSIAPAFEYNWNANLGIVVGAWFSVYGRNSLSFASGVFTVSYTFP
jgi:hypothetical protein